MDGVGGWGGVGAESPSNLVTFTQIPRYKLKSERMEHLPSTSSSNKIAITEALSVKIRQINHISTLQLKIMVGSIPPEFVFII
jgi:hypothetical protein